MKRISILIISALSLLLSAVPTGAQPVGRRVELPVSDMVKAATFDGKGFLWIGTTAGLMRYDGYNFQQIRNTLKTPSLLSDNGIEALAANGHGSLWIATDNGITCLELASLGSHVYRMPTPRQSLVYCIYPDADGSVYGGTDGGMVVYDRHTDSFRLMRGTEHLCVKAIVNDGSGHLFIGTWSHGLWMYDKRSRRMHRVAVDGDNYYCLTFDSHGRLWAGSWRDGVRLIDNPTAPHPTVKAFSGTGGEPVYNIVAITGDNVLACARSKVFRFDPAQHIEVIPATSDEMNAVAVENGVGTVALVKKSEAVEFFSTFSTALNIIPVAPYADGLLRGAINKLVTTDGRLFWLGSRITGVSTFEMGATVSPHATAVPQLRAIAPELVTSSCKSMITDSHGNVWIGNMYSGAVAVHPDGSATALDLTSRSYTHENAVCTMMEDRDGNIWFGQMTNVVILARNGRTYNIPLAKYIPNIGRGEVTHIMQDHRGRVWICTRDNGVLRVDPSPGRKAKDQPWLMPGTVCHTMKYAAAGAITCAEDKYGQIVFLTSAGEVLLWDNAHDCSNTVAETDNDDVRYYSAITDIDGNIWLGGTNSIVRTSRDSSRRLVIQRFCIPAQNSRLNLMENAVFRRGAMLYFGASNKIVAIDTRRLGSTSPMGMKLSISTLTIDGREFAVLDSAMQAKLTKSVPSYTKEITVPYGVRVVKLGFSNLDFANVTAVRYEYRLDGYNDEWKMSAEGGHTATFENLPAGKYTFHLRATDTNGRWVEMPYTITIRVLPPWWRSWWAYIIYILMAVAAGWGIIVWYRQRVRTQNRLRMAQVFTNITHELLTPISVVQASIDAQKKNIDAGAYTIIRNNMTRLTRLIRQILEIDKLNAGRLVIELSDNDMNEFLRQETDNMRPLAMQRGVSLTFTTRGRMPIHCLFDTDKLDKIVYNLISNAIKHTAVGGHVVVGVAYDKGFATITVADNGTGISKARMKQLFSRFMDGDYRSIGSTGTGIGLSLTRDLVRKLKGTISVESTEGEGTTFTVVLPISREAGAKGASAEDVAKAAVKETVTTEGGEAGAQPVADGNAAEPADGSAVAAGADEAEPDADGEKESSRYTVLLVEDNIDLIDIMATFLGQWYNILRANNGRQALTVLERNAVDIVVTDVMMPVMGGIELTKKIKANADYAMMPVIMLTAKVRDDDRDEGYKVGADAYLAKPFSLETLHLRIENFIANRERIRQKFKNMVDDDTANTHYSNPDEQFVQRCIAKVKENIAEENYDRERFARDMCMSGSSLYKKLHALTGLGVMAFINDIRLKEACRIMRANPSIAVNDLYVRVGYASPTYFRRLFKQQFGITPTEFLEKVRKERRCGE
ncbi:hybrid sensor histidine kinase/response regulator transcription factor [Prevotella lacticifex]|uniref:hybrid sensor histidine kinase/response regulator transcription factor n=1 Tax=Prevotella lacticifex TaxID=2854755 RepID=UPI001CC755BB|nr:ATP-binding protein [Prevotella lacticifex]